MKKTWYGIFVLALLCVSFIFSGKAVHAASTPAESATGKIAYVDSSKRALVLKFEDFARSGYTYKVTRGNTDVAAGTVEYGKKMIQVPLGSLYKNNKKYVLVLTGRDRAKKLTVRYYTGDALTGCTVTQKSNGSVKAVWSAANKTTYSGYFFGMYLGAYATVKQAGNPTTAAKTAQTVAAASVRNATYYTYLRGYKKVKNKIYYGQGYEVRIDCVKKPGRVVGVTATPNTGRAKLSWNAVSGASSYIVYLSTSSAKGYKAVKNTATTSVTVKGLTAGKRYYFKVAAVSRVGAKSMTGAQSAAANAKIPVVPGQVKNVKAALSSKGILTLSWKKTKNASGYKIYYKKTSETSYKALGKTKKTSYNLSALDMSAQYNIRVCAYKKANGKTYLSDKKSKAITVSPSKYKGKNYYKLLASQVRSIGYIGKKCVYTTKKYSTEVKSAFVNTKGYSSKTKYLIWVSHYTQQVTIYKGSKGKWKQIRTFACSTGNAETRSPRGVFKISYKEKGWFYTYTKELYVTHYYKRNSFHTRPLWNNGTVQDPTIGKPASHGCVRCYNQDAKYIYDKMPKGTTVVSY